VTANDTAGDGADPIPDDDWRSIVAHVPVVSVDLLVRYDSGVLLGKRTNEPAKGEWFVPGGTVLKGERLAEAVDRVADEELGIDVEIESRLGTYEHFYDAADVEGVDGKHYVATAFVVRPVGAERETPRDDQHSDLQTLEGDEAGLHPYVSRYLRDAGLGGDHGGENEGEDEDESEERGVESGDADEAPGASGGERTP
jgi:colanic acid biosynthesis protein WcaH